MTRKKPATSPPPRKSKKAGKPAAPVRPARPRPAAPAETPAPVLEVSAIEPPSGPDVALRIRETAEAHKVPVVENAALARALYATVEIDEVIPREHYEAVAKIIGFILAGRRPRRRARTL